MLNLQQNTCINLVVNNMPEPIRESPVIVDVADDSMRHIMGGDPLESLFMKSIRQVLTNVANGNLKNWIDYLKMNHLDNFCNCFLNKSPEIMISIFDNCSWADSAAEKKAKFIIKPAQFLLEIDNKTFINYACNTVNSSNFKWFPYIMRRLCTDGVNKIDIQFEGSPSEFEQLHVLKRQFFACIRSTNFSQRGNHIYPTVMVDWKYDVFYGSVCFSAHSKRKGGAMVFAKFNRGHGKTQREINEVMLTDFI